MFNGYKNRVMFSLFSVTLIFLVLLGLIFKIMIIDGDELKERSFKQSSLEYEIKPKRGTIYDRKGVPLAVSVDAYSVAFDPVVAKKDEKILDKIKQLAGILDIPEESLVEDLNKKRRFIWLERQIEDNKADQIRLLKMPSVKLIKESKRLYPKKNLASNVIGFVGVDNNGLEGLELEYEKILRGVPGKIIVEGDSKGRSIDSDIHMYVPPVDGKDIYLTIDETIQYEVEKNLASAVEELEAEKALAIVYNVKTGEVIAMGNYPNYDPNRYKDFPKALYKNISVSSNYEPGSTFKIFIASAALEEKMVTLTETFKCVGAIRILDRKIRCWVYPRSHGLETIAEALQDSCNPTFVQIGQRLGIDIVYKYINGFGFGRKTGIDLVGEGSGIIFPYEKTTKLDLAMMSIGQGNAVTPIQLIRALGAVANDGMLMKPYVVSKISNDEGEYIQQNNPEIIRKVISKETSDKMKALLTSVVEEGTGKRGKIPGYNVAAKTGTAQKILPTGGYSEDDLITSFIGFAPSDDPMFACLVVVDSPQKVKSGSQTAGPVFKAVLQKTLDYYDVYPEIEALKPKPVEKTANSAVTVKNYTGTDYEKHKNEFSRYKDNFNVHGEGDTIVAQYPFTESSLRRGDKIDIYLGKKDAGDVIVPDLSDLSILDATRLLEDMGFIIKVNGRGYAVSQNPSPFETQRRNSIIRVDFESK